MDPNYFENLVTRNLLLKNFKTPKITEELSGV